MLLCMEQRIVKEDHKIAFPHSLNLKMTICLIVNPGKRKREKEHKNEEALCCEHPRHKAFFVLLHGVRYQHPFGTLVF